MMDDFKVGTTIFSITAPGACIIKDFAGSGKLARDCNEFCAEIRDSNPARYGFFATLPSLLYIKGALEEIAYSLDILKADGVCLFTRYGEGMHYLGHRDFRPIWEALNLRSAVVFTHPTSPADKRQVSRFIGQTSLDYPHETTRTAVDMITQGIVRKYAQCKVILSHAGGTLPFIIARPAINTEHNPIAKREGLGMTTAQWYEDARRFYYDTALSSSESQLGALLLLAGPDHILFGSDYPYAPLPSIYKHTELNDSYQFKEGVREQVWYKNALKLFPRFANDGELNYQ